MKINEEAAQKLFDDGWVTCVNGHWTQTTDEHNACPTCGSPQLAGVEQLLTAIP